jgi:hypothetical protein
MRPLTPQQIADAAAKRAASVAARKANGGMTVRQQRAAAKAAKAGQPFVPPAPRAPRPAPAPRPFGRRRRGFGRNVSHVSTPAPSGPVFTTPKPSLRPLRLAALVALEDCFKQTVAELQRGTPTQDQRDAWATYKKVKARFLDTMDRLSKGASVDSGSQNEADVALRMAALTLTKLAF